MYYLKYNKDNSPLYPSFYYGPTHGWDQKKEGKLYTFEEAFAAMRNWCSGVSASDKSSTTIVDEEDRVVFSGVFLT